MLKINSLLKICFLLIAVSCTVLSAADWPTRLCDNYRRGMTTEHVSLPISQAWVKKTNNPAEPAWTNSPALHNYYSGTYNLKPRQNFDFCFDVAVVGQRLYFGSSNTGEITCLDASTGQRIWTFFTDGPVRFSPTVVNGRVYAGSDDGCVYCLDAADGSVIWSERVGGDDMIWGNEHMISVWPVRTSVLVDGDYVYWAAGLFPEEKLYFCKRNASDGSAVWTVTPPLPPQGYLLATAGSVIVPSGKTYPMVFSKSGSHSGYLKSSTRDGGCWAVISPDGNDIVTGPTVTGDVQQFSTSTQVRVATISNANYMIIGTGYSFYNTNDKLFKISRTDRTLVWSVDMNCPYSLIKADDKVFAGGDGIVEARDANTGQLLWSAEVDDRVYGLAVANESLFVSTAAGSIYCFNSKLPVVDNAQGAQVETAESATLTGSLQAGKSFPVDFTFHWGSQDGGDDAGSWLAGSTQSLTELGDVSCLVDGLEADKTYYYRCSASNQFGSAWSQASSAFITGQLSIQALQMEVAEEGEPVKIQISRPDSAAAGDLVVNYTLSGTAVSGQDYQALSGQCVIPDGRTVAVIEVAPIDDTTIESGDESVTLTLSAGGYLLGDNPSVTINIIDNEVLEGWAGRTKVTVTGYTGQETLENFPLMLVLNNSTPGFSYSQVASPENMRFVDVLTNQYIDFEVESWNTSGDSIIWVNMPAISGSFSGAWLYWWNDGSSQLPPAGEPAECWAGGYANVWHMSPAGGKIPDSRSGYTATPLNGVSMGVAGIIGKAAAFDGNDDYMTTDSLLTIGSGSSTVSAWIKVPAVGTGGLTSGERVGIVIGNYSASPNCNWELHSVGQSRLYWNGGQINTYGSFDFRDNQWHHIAWVRDLVAGKCCVYVDGQLNATYNGVGSDVTFSLPHNIGSDRRNAGGPNFHGMIDELRLSNKARSVDWLKACWKSQSDSAGFVTFEAQ